MYKEKENRKEKILEILKEKKSISVKELSKIFNVSEMTIYRDIKELEKEDLIEKNHGSINTPSLEKKQEKNKTEKTCPICFKKLDTFNSYKILLNPSQVIEACCEHCGFILHQRYEQVNVSAICYDFITKKPINPFEAFFVVDSEAIPCCNPSVIAFYNKNDAIKFVNGFGGKVLNFIETYNLLKNRTSMNLYSCCHDDINKKNPL